MQRTISNAYNNESREQNRLFLPSERFDPLSPHERPFALRRNGLDLSPSEVPPLDPLRSSGRLPRPRYLTWRSCSGFLRTVGLFSCPSSSRRIVPGFYILSSEVEFVVLRPSTSVLFPDGPGRRQTRVTV